MVLSTNTFIAYKMGPSDKYDGFEFMQWKDDFSISQWMMYHNHCEFLQGGDDVAMRTHEFLGALYD